jgi:hypothetical protein
VISNRTALILLAILFAFGVWMRLPRPVDSKWIGTDESVYGVYVDQLAH